MTPPTMSAPIPPMTEADYDAINRDLRDLARIKEELAVAMKAGIPCEEQCKACEQLIKANELQKAGYFPNRP